MCRLFTAIHLNKSELRKGLHEFQQLADCGCVPDGMPSGHRDGWGIAAYGGGAVKFFAKYPKDASRDPRYEDAVKKVEGNAPSIVLLHFRKKSVGAVSLHNTQPYRYGTWTFGHNGTVYGGEKIPLSPKFRKFVKGTNDSERLFLSIMQRLASGAPAKSDPARAVIAAIRSVRERYDYTAMNIIMSDGKTVFALREINEKNRFVKEKKLMGYYTLFLGKSRHGGFVIASEKLPIAGFSWKPLANHSLVAVPVAGRSNRIRRYKA